MNAYKDILISLAKRGLVAAPFFAVGFFVLFRAGGSLGEGAAGGLFGCALLIGGAIIFALPLARLIAEPFGSLYWDSTPLAGPSPVYSIPEARRISGHYEEAMALYEKLVEEYPDEVQPYIHMIEIAIMNLKDPARAKHIYDRGMEHFKAEETQAILTTMYRAILTRLHDHPHG